MYFAEPTDEYARRYVCDRTARLYSSDQTGEAPTIPIALDRSDALRFIFWNHHQCYGPAASPAARN
jgi:hypothetical protein